MWLRVQVGMHGRIAWAEFRMATGGDSSYDWELCASGVCYNWREFIRRLGPYLSQYVTVTIHTKLVGGI